MPLEEIENLNLPNNHFKTVYEALAPILTESQTAKEQGAKYEALCVYYLKADPFWSNFYSRVAGVGTGGILVRQPCLRAKSRHRNRSICANGG